MAKIAVRYSRKKSDGNYGSTEVSMSIEHDSNDIDGGLTQTYNYLRKKVEGFLQ